MYSPFVLFADTNDEKWSKGLLEWYYSQLAHYTACSVNSGVWTCIWVMFYSRYMSWFLVVMHRLSIFIFFQWLLSWLLHKWTGRLLPTWALHQGESEEAWTNTAIYSHALLRIHVIGVKGWWGLLLPPCLLDCSSNQGLLVLHLGWSASESVIWRGRHYMGML